MVRLGMPATAVALLHRLPRPDGAVPDLALLAAAGIDRIAAPGMWDAVLVELRNEGVLATSEAAAEPYRPEDMAEAAARIRNETPTQQVLRPFWAHLQPFTLCNQHCLHCYCDGGPGADPFTLPLDTWRQIIAALDDYGVFDVYLTGGESLLLDGFFTLAEEILSRGLGFGLSTNATVLSPRVLDRLKGLRIATVQVSLDGAHPSIHEKIRGARGSFTRTLEGIDRITAQGCEVVINTVVNRLNLGELEDIVRLGVDHDCRRFKFFPQKPTGRAARPPVREMALDDTEVLTDLMPTCTALSEQYAVEIETIDAARPCGSGSLGFAIDQSGDIYPCIFGIGDPAQRCGNILRDGLDQVWFGSPVLARFRAEQSVPIPCRRCEA